MHDDHVTEQFRYVHRIGQRSTEVLWFLPRGMLTGWVEVNPILTPAFIVAVFRDQT